MQRQHYAHGKFHTEALVNFNVLLVHFKPVTEKNIKYGVKIILIEYDNRCKKFIVNASYGQYIFFF